MTKLIRAGIKRMFRIKTLYLCFAFLFFIDGFDMIKEYICTGSEGNLPSADGYLMSGFLTMVVLSAVFITSFLGSEHSFGTVRNKMSVGHGRLSIYLSSFAVCYTAVMLMYAEVWLLSGGLGKLLLGGFTYSTKELLVKILVTFLAATLLTALFVLTGLCIHSKSMSSVTAVVAAFLMMISGVMTIQILSEPEYYPVEKLAVEEVQFYEPVPGDPEHVMNPNYVTGTKRKMFEILHEVCPVSQVLAATDEVAAKNVFIPVCEFAVFFAAGMYIFKKRDLK